ncbi:hypothetical protein EQO05_12355 [Methanosarcina sp. MSH10X1]|uniref:hypothetical protein n=1 Tax=Methanosarcina sp. MSH10X1 TaxID=2507075 RepID=UPI000FFBBA12|nr:hypothetical protein [Methanosarcina sp. MSH10X1]RXA17429.1 hypothetical protein EQO05_12355 [Methanosarcina sp. MSH10X1]
METIESLAHFILKVFKLLIVDPIQKIERFLIILKRRIRKELRSDIFRWVTSCIICSLLVGYLTHLYSNFYENNTDNVQSFLNSISQGLAAFFALVFTISIFGAQTMGIFTALDKVMDKWTKTYMVLFSFGIIFPIWQLITGKYSFNLFLFLENKGITLPLLQLKIGTHSINLYSVGNIDFLALDMILASFCVLAIIPFTIKINRIAKYEVGISKLYGEAKVAINSGNEVVSSDNISRLGELGRSALKESLPDEVMSITTGIRRLGNLSLKNNLKDSTTQAIIELKSLGFIAMNQKTKIGYYPVPWPVMNSNISLPEYPIAWNITNGFREICIGSIDTNSDELTVSVSCELLFYIGYMYVQKIRTTYHKTISRQLRMILPNQLSLIGGDWSNRKTPTIAEMLFEIAEKATKKKESLFCWNDVTRKDLDKINKFFREDLQMYFEAWNIKKIDDEKTIIFFGNISNYSLVLEYKQAILSHQSHRTGLEEPECVKVLPISKKDGKIYICRFKYNETLKHSLIYLWIIGTYIMKNYPTWVTERLIFQIRRSEKSDIRSIFESEYIQQETSRFIRTDGIPDDFKDIVNYIEEFREFYFGFEDYLQHKRD